MCIQTELEYSSFLKLLNRLNRTTVAMTIAGPYPNMPPIMTTIAMTGRMISTIIITVIEMITGLSAIQIIIINKPTSGFSATIMVATVGE